MQWLVETLNTSNPSTPTKAHHMAKPDRRARKYSLTTRQAESRGLVDCFCKYSQLSILLVSIMLGIWLPRLSLLNRQNISPLLNTSSPRSPKCSQMFTNYVKGSVSADFQLCSMTERSPILRGVTEPPRGVWGVRGTHCSPSSSRHNWAPQLWPLSPYSGLSWPQAPGTVRVQQRASKEPKPLKIRS